MANPRYPHLFLAGPSNTRSDYSSPRRGGSSPRLRPQERVSHAAYVTACLNQAWATACERQAVAHGNRHGVYLEFSSEPGFDLIVKSLEARGSGVRLLNVRKVGTPDQETTRATVFVPHSKSGHFLRKAAAYASEDNRPKKDGSTTPKNSDLINSIGDVRAAVLEASFWQDAAERLPGDTPDWVEVWLSSEDLAVLETFRSLCREQDIGIGEGNLTFPERTVLLVYANRAQLEDVIQLSDNIAELRAAREVASFFLEQENRNQTEWVDELLQRTEFRDPGEVVVLVLDHGVNNGHRLLQPLLADDDCHAVHVEWGTHDHHGHETLMAGTAAYGDLQACLEQTRPMVVRHSLESAKILPPPPESNPKRLWGYFTSQGVSQAEIQAPEPTRIICMAVSSDLESTRGRPTSWSGQIDEMASGYSDEKRRLVILSAGNVDSPEDWKAYPDSNMTCEVQDPAQAWNALTIGAFTEKESIRDPLLGSYWPIAKAGGLSPFSSTSAAWPDRKWPIKPEILFEGGNVAAGPGDRVFDSDDLKLLSTYHDPQTAQFAAFDATSAASAQAAWMAARIQVAYPEAWPETIRALMVHSAEWSEAQKRAFLSDESKTAYYRLAKICGYGIPDLRRAISCATNALSLIVQTQIQPFDKHEAQSRYITKEMHIYRLPWPAEVLSDLGTLPIEMRVTLSYFVEPSPGEVGWKDRYRYPSHGLRFEINGIGETETEFVQRLNRRARDDDEHPGTESASDRWRIGEARNVGSIHSDYWSGSAADLALSNLVAVYPTVGWWRERHHLGKYAKQTRYSLIVSFSLPGQEIDIYTPVAIELGIPVGMEIAV